MNTQDTKPILTKSNIKSSLNTRAIATQVLTEVLLSKQSLSQVLPNFKKLCPKAQDAAFVQALCFGVLRFFSRLKFIALQLLSHPLKKKDEDILILICVGLYQLIDLNTAVHAAISETVEASRQIKKPWASGLVNALLRNFLRKQPSLLLAAEQNAEAKHQHPQWLIEQFKKAWPNDFETIILANNSQAPLVLRVNAQKIPPEAYLEKLTAAGITASRVEGTEAGIILETACDVAELPGFYEGLVSVQDGAAQLAATLLEPAKGMRILDACAAPGGKTAHLLEKEPSLSELLALDISEERNLRIMDNLKRLQLKATVVTGDASQPKHWWDGQLFDRILLDAPCSATGVIRRHPDIKFLRQANDIAKLAEQQLSLLKNLWPLLKPGGSLLYATCSILPAENAKVIEKFLNLESTASLLPMTIAWGQALALGHQLLPGQNNMDGFYYARIGKIVK
jgi:16S rRNA (cytosine967-C5)-methyltransferase